MDTGGWILGILKLQSRLHEHYSETSENSTVLSLSLLGISDYHVLCFCYYKDSTLCVAYRSTEYGMNFFFLNFVLNRKPKVLKIFEFLCIPELLRKLSTYSTGTPMAFERPLLLVAFPKDSVLISCLD